VLLGTIQYRYPRSNERGGLTMVSRESASGSVGRSYIEVSWTGSAIIARSLDKSPPPEPATDAAYTQAHCRSRPKGSVGLCLDDCRPQRIRMHCKGAMMASVHANPPRTVNLAAVAVINDCRRIG
jgi:hypothetical protein